ncbi:MAG TPA: hypothetical protein VFO10_11335 [Oligoflexus sp.]|uniref:hypothetical protein n=1 Tax=Oligoflexus sp. TaxID=1971216 RepID=UPI002D80DE9B|nr:hypothetical protein [Oligoflexus sp.]HET9237838.1 hypothetical protein [Oligoflexus sp.]
MKVRNLLTLIMTTALSLACESAIEDVTSQRPTSNVAFTEADGVVTATISSASGSDQILVASAVSKAADAQVTFPPGALAIDAEISIGEATDQSAAILNELSSNSLVQAGSPVYIGPTAAGSTVEIGQALTIQLPIPLETIGASNLVMATSKLVLIYTIYDRGWKSGLIPLTKENLVGAFLKVSLSGLGYFQVAYLASEGTLKEVASAVRPALGKSGSSSTGGGGGSAMADYKGFYAGAVTELANLEANGAAGNGKYCAINSSNFKMWLSPYSILLYKVSTPAPGSVSSDFDGDLASFEDISNEEPSSFTRTYKAGSVIISTQDTGLRNTGVKYMVADLNASSAFSITVTGGFSGTAARKYNGSLSAFIGQKKVCEYTLDLTRQ